MIKDKKLGLKIAENPTEALWERTRIACDMRIKDCEETLIVEKAFLEMCKEKLKTSIKK